MSEISTEFPLKSGYTKGRFVAQTIFWLQGTTYSKVFEDFDLEKIEKESPHIISASGEEIRFSSLGDKSGEVALGFRHDYPDDLGRIWRTEAVIYRDAGGQLQDLLRLKTQCISNNISATIETPRKPHLIKSIIDDGWAGNDDHLAVSDQPHWLSDDDNNLDLARRIATGAHHSHLPIIYISTNDKSKTHLSHRTISDIAFNLGGVAHVVVEPSRAFSIRLRDACGGTNVYGGVVGISLPQRGFVAKFWTSFGTKQNIDLVEKIQSHCLKIRTQMPSAGWDWIELQENTLKHQRIQNKNKLSVDQIEKLYTEEISTLQEQNEYLKNQLKEISNRDISNIQNSENLIESAKKFVGAEIYSGEISDRLRYGASLALKHRDMIGLDKRSTAVFLKIVENTESSPSLAALTDELKSATTSAKHMSKSLIDVLERHGYVHKADKNHVVMSPDEGLTGLDSITIPKTPSDHRGMINQRTDIEKILGINKLKKLSY